MKTIAYICGAILYVLSILFALQTWGGIGALLAFFVPVFTIAFPVVAQTMGYAVPMWLWALWALGIGASIAVSAQETAE